MESPVVIGAGDCPHCGGDVVFDLHGDSVEDSEKKSKKRRSRLRKLLDR